MFIVKKKKKKIKNTFFTKQYFATYIAFSSIIKTYIIYLQYLQ